MALASESGKTRAQYDAEFKPIREAFTAMVTAIDHAETGTAKVERDATLKAADLFYSGFVKPYFDMSVADPKQRLNAELRRFYRRETGLSWDGEVNGNDLIGLSPAVRWFLGAGTAATRQYVSRLNTLAGAAAFYTLQYKADMSPTDIVENNDIGKGNIDRALKAFRTAFADTNDAAKEARDKRNENRRQNQIDALVADMDMVTELVKNDAFLQSIAASPEALAVIASASEHRDITGIRLRILGGKAALDQLASLTPGIPYTIGVTRLPPGRGNQELDHFELNWIPGAPERTDTEQPGEGEQPAAPAE